MKRKKIEELGIFNVVLIGDNPRVVSIADNIHAKFKDGGGTKNVCNFNIITDMEDDGESKSWFNEFIYDLTTTSNFNNIIISRKFKEWMVSGPKPMEKLYMKMLLQALNAIVVDVSDTEDMDDCVFDYDIPQFTFNDQRDFLDDMVKWIDGQVSKIVPKMTTIRLIRSMCGKNLPYLGDVFGCLSGKRSENIVVANGLRFDVPILFDEFCKLARGRTMDELGKSVITRTSSALSVFFK